MTMVLVHLTEAEVAYFFSDTLADPSPYRGMGTCDDSLQI
jgi:hypothetical protein